MCLFEDANISRNVLIDISPKLLHSCLPFENNQRTRGSWKLELESLSTLTVSCLQLPINYENIFGKHAFEKEILFKHTQLHRRAATSH